MDCIGRMVMRPSVSGERESTFSWCERSQNARIVRRQTGVGSKTCSLEKELKKRLDVHEAVIITILQRVMDIIDPPLTPEPPKPRIGFKR
jgi:hypothetical protein